MKKVIPIILILIGLGCLGIGIFPLIKMNKEVNESIEQWEEIKNNQSADNSKGYDQDILGMMRISSFDKLIPIRLGTSDSILKKGAGVDSNVNQISESGNSVIYGHREEIFWNLKHVKVGDLIYIETLDGELEYKIEEIEIVDPDDEWIYKESDESTLTLVTCYPFIYMGPTPERYVVKAMLIK